MTDEQNLKINWLSRALNAEKKIKALEYHKNRDRERAQRVTASLGGVSAGRSDFKKNSVEDRLVSFADSEKRYVQALDEYNSVRREIETAIGSIPDPVIEAVFIYRYLEYRSMADIAEEMMFDIRTVQRKHKSGLEMLSLNVIVCH